MSIATCPTVYLSSIATELQQLLRKGSTDGYAVDRGGIFIPKSEYITAVYQIQKKRISKMYIPKKSLTQLINELEIFG
ncbi:hypothetical protein [Risungbinella massiliensis]|uniref:hypothetical protein n=1 Tax=Risungbinella massiliensis TaxID=1329796 RepID=UPI0011CB49BF|nr:hypothetical protein [Risungbinella massiliensis]